jgi:carbamoyl-phosphate synthase large subunit
MNVLVLGVGGHVSQGILKALARSSLPIRTVGACISPLARGLYMTDRAYVSPLASDDGFVDWLINTCRAEDIQAIFSGVEPNLAVMSDQAEKIRSQTGAVCIVSRPEVLAVGGDKLKTCQWLESKGFNFPRYADCANPEAVQQLVSECGYPLIAKPRRGRGSVGVIEINNSVGLQYALSQPAYILQELLGNGDSEYTVGCFSDKENRLRGIIAMRRALYGGTTCRAEVVALPEVLSETTRIVEALKPTGPANVQFRVVEGRPVCFEINVRFSGTTSLRADLGWNDVDAALKHFVLGQPAQDLPTVTNGLALRYWDEVYIDPSAVAQLTDSGRLDHPERYVLLTRQPSYTT